MRRKRITRIKLSKFYDKPVECDVCGIMTDDPYVRHIVPPYITSNYMKSSHKEEDKKIPKKIPKQVPKKRVDFTGYNKIAIYNYCNFDCYHSSSLLAA